VLRNFRVFKALAGSMKRSGVRLTVCPIIIRPPHAAAAGLLLSARRAASGHRSIAARQALSSECEQCHVYSWRRKAEHRLVTVLICLCTCPPASISPELHIQSSLFFALVTWPWLGLPPTPAKTFDICQSPKGLKV